MPTEQKVALLSVFNKEGIVEFAKDLISLGWKIVSSGGTAKKISEAGLPVQDVAEFVGGGAILGHKVVTLSREIGAALLANDSPEETAELERIKIPRIELVRVDMYPLKDEIARPGATRESVIEKTDIGGPTMLREAAKGRRIVICDSADQQKTIDWLKDGEPDKDIFITELVAKAEALVADYVLASAKYHGQGKYQGFVGNKFLECLYGENAWQTPAALFSREIKDSLALDNFKVITGTAPSYNNLCDLDRLLQTITHVAAVYELNHGKVPLIAIAAKHGNPCGAAIGTDPVEVIKNMVIGDLIAIHGGLVITNFTIGEAEADALLHHKMEGDKKRLFDGVIAPEFSDPQVFERKNGKCRLISNPALATLGKESLDQAQRFRYVRGGFLCQPNYTYVLDLKDQGIQKIGQANSEQEYAMLLAWAIGSTSNSNTITLVRVADNGAYLISNGVGQQDRVGACALNDYRSGRMHHKTRNAVAYSDSFFPFADGPEYLSNMGIAFVFATSGSINDQSVRDCFGQDGVIFYQLPDKQARGFFGH